MGEANEAQAADRLGMHNYRGATVVSEQPTPETVLLERELSTGPWKVVRGPYDGSDWLIASLGADHNGHEWYITTDRVPASQATSEPEADARAIVAWRNSLCR